MHRLAACRDLQLGSPHIGNQCCSHSGRVSGIIACRVHMNGSETPQQHPQQHLNVIYIICKTSGSDLSRDL